MKVSTILDNIDNGAMALPEFQRGYVWSRAQVRGLMHSLYRGHPVGGLLTWRTRTEDASARGDGQLQAGTVQLLLDGQQRITTLYGLIRGRPPEFFDGNQSAFTDLRFHLDDQVFEFWQPVKMRDDPCWIDVSDLMRKGAGAVIDEMYSASGEAARNIGPWITRLNAIDQIKQRDFHVEEVTGDDKTVDVVVDIFNRVNSGGTKLSKGDLALAKICAEWPDARPEFKKRLTKWSERGFDFTLDLLLRVINAIATGKAPFSALADQSVEDVKVALDKAERAMDKTLNTLSSRLGLDHGRVLPSPYSLPVMARYLADKDFRFADHRERDRLLFWYVHSAMWGRYAGSTETVLQQDLLAVTAEGGDAIDRLVANLRQQRGNLDVRPADFRSWGRGARFYPILYMLTRTSGARDWGSGELLRQHALGAHTNLEIHHIFPKKILYAAGQPRAEVNAIANFTFLSQETNRSISDTPPAKYMPGFLEKHPGAVESHWIPDDEALWAVERYPAFLERRRVLLAEATTRFLDQLWSGTRPEIEPFEGLTEPVAPREPVAAAEDEEAVCEEVQRWLAEEGFDPGELNHALVEADGSQSAVLDIAWPQGLQPELSDPVALLLDEPFDVWDAAIRHGYRPFRDVETLKKHATDLATVGDAATTGA